MTFWPGLAVHTRLGKLSTCDPGAAVQVWERTPGTKSHPLALRLRRPLLPPGMQAMWVLTGMPHLLPLPLLPPPLPLPAVVPTGMLPLLPPHKTSLVPSTEPSRTGVKPCNCAGQAVCCAFPAVLPTDGL